MPDPEIGRSRPSVVDIVALSRNAEPSIPAALRNLRAPDSRIGLVRLGQIGSGIAINLMRSGMKIVANTHRRERAAELAAVGLEASIDFAEPRDCPAVVTSLPDNSAVREVIFGSESGRTGLLDCLGPGAIHLSMSTISPAADSEFAVEHILRGQGYVTAPVFGNSDTAKARQPYILTAGAADDVNRYQPIFDAGGRRTFRIGADPANANLIKLAANALTAVTMETLGEVLALARKRGLPINAQRLKAA
jgi:3-hydroxyisobutyrate dehydrogenase-like beta-hydroxyacid dehydrogenase